MTPEDRELAVRVAERAAEIVEKGWCQGKSADGLGNYCALGAHGEALYEVLGEFDGDFAVELSRRASKHIEPYGHKYIDAWNDAPERTQAEVVDMWKHVAKSIANGE